VPKNERCLKRHERSCVLRHEARRVVSDRATCRNRSTIGEATHRSGHRFAALHGERERALIVLRIRVEFDLHGIGVDIVEKNLNVK